MIFYKCNTCGLLCSELFKKCPSCGVESVKTQEEYSKTVPVEETPQNTFKDYCPKCNGELEWTCDINDNAKVGEDPRIYGLICSNCEYEN